jgi:hypothetical protein
MLKEDGRWNTLLGASKNNRVLEAKEKESIGLGLRLIHPPPSSL